VKVERVGRELLETELTFVGVVAMENRLKPVTTSVIRQLHTAQVRTVMCTGDNLLTAVSVARDCDIINAQLPLCIIDVDETGEQLHVRRASEPTGNDSLRRFRRRQSTANGVHIDINYNDTPVNGDATCRYRVHVDDDDAREMAKAGDDHGDVFSTLANYQCAMTGAAFAHLLATYPPTVIEQLMYTSCVYARMSPDQKATLIDRVQQLDYTVAMCGDGANDCGALKVRVSEYARVCTHRPHTRASPCRRRRRR
jgi:cation-transporting ATPase 13A3/4/5